MHKLTLNSLHCPGFDLLILQVSFLSNGPTGVHHHARHLTWLPLVCFLFVCFWSHFIAQIGFKLWFLLPPLLSAGVTRMCHHSQTLFFIKRQCFLVTEQVAIKRKGFGTKTNRVRTMGLAGKGTEEQTHVTQVHTLPPHMGIEESWGAPYRAKFSWELLPTLLLPNSTNRVTQRTSPPCAHNCPSGV